MIMDDIKNAVAALDVPQVITEQQEF